MKKREYSFTKILVFCLALGIVCFGMESLSLGAEPKGSVFLVAQGSSSQPPNSVTSPSPAAPQPSTTEPPSGLQPATPASPERSVSPPLGTVPGTSPAVPPRLQRKRLAPVPQQPIPPASQPSPPTAQLPSPPVQRQPPVPTPGPGPAPVVPGPTPPAPRPFPPASATRTGSGVVFNFDNADIYEVIRVMSEILKINYIIDPRVKGVVNIHTSGQIASADVFPIFQSILRLNGATALKKDGIYEIVPLPEAKKLPSLPSPPQDAGKPVVEERYVIQILPLKYVPVTEVSKMIKPFLSDGADIVEHPPSNILIIGDLASNVKKSMEIIHLFDTDVFTGMRVRIYPVLNADVTEVVKEMEKIFASFEVSTKSGRGVGITFTPITRINSLLAVSSIPNIFEKVEAWLKELDKIPMEGTKYSVFVYHCQNAKAKDLAEVLKQVYVPSKEKKTEFKEKVTEQAPRGTKLLPTAPSAPPSAPTEGGGIPEGEINVVVDETNNALVVRAFARDYKSILETIKRLDIYPRQVLIEVLLADIGLKDDTEMGVDFVRYMDGGKWQQSITYGTFSHLAEAGPGITYSIVKEGQRFAASIRAAATLGRARILTSPHLLASNNKEAKIQIGTSEPILTNTYTSTGTATTTTPTGFVEGTIEYKDIGTILSITPRISDGGLVTLELSIEESSLEQRTIGRQTSEEAVAGIASASSSFLVPAFKKTTAKTVLSIKEGQTIAIGGLIRKEKAVRSEGVPFLSKIPLLGFLFGKNTDFDERRELILLLTPRIITDEIQSKTATDEFREKIEGLREEYEKAKKKKEEK
jgi:general secretion pathway protein D